MGCAAQSTNIDSEATLVKKGRRCRPQVSMLSVLGSGARRRVLDRAVPRSGAASRKATPPRAPS